MPAFPIGLVTTLKLDENSDNAGDARAELLLAVQRLNAILNSFAQADGICPLDGTSQVPAAQLGNCASKKPTIFQT